MAETWLVTGGAGFIGSNFVHRVLAHRPDVRVVVLDKLTYAGSLENLRDLPDPSRFAFERGDIARPEDIARCLSAHRPVRILNFAAESHVDRTIDGPRACIETNLVGTFELLEAARSYFPTLSPRDRAAFRLLHVSTDEVFGSLPASGRFDERSPYAPNSPYAASKAGADLLVRSYHRTFDLPTITTNCSNNFGPRQHPEKLVPLMLLNALEGRPLPVYGDGGNVRDWIYVEDHCAGVIQALEHGEPGQQYVFGADNERTNLELIDALCRVLEELRPARENPALARAGLHDYRSLRRFVTDRPGHDRRYAVDPTRAHRELGWVPETTFEAGLRRTIEWYLANDAWLQAIEAAGSTRTRRGLAGGDARSAPAANADGESA